MHCIDTFNDGDPVFNTSITNYRISDIPFPTSYVRVLINGLEASTGSKTSECYFSSDGGTTARSIGSERYGDFLYWNGSKAGYQLKNTFIVDFIYLK